MSAQDIYFCSNYTDNGEPVGASKSWILDQNGGDIYILFNNQNKHIKTKSIVAHILKQSGSKYLNYEKRAMDIKNENTWAILDYQFIEGGNYQVSIEDNTGKILATDNLNIEIRNISENLSMGTGRNKNDTVHKDPDKDYYHATTVFSKSLVNGKPEDIGSIFTAGEVNVFIQNDKPLETDSLIVDVFKKGFETEKYPIYITTKNIAIKLSQKEAGFILNFNETGRYKVVVYNSRSQKISEGYLSIR